MEKDLTKSLETYLITIDKLLKRKKDIIVKDVALYLNYGGATAADAIKRLKEKGYVNYIPYGNITLTRKGEEAVLLRTYRHNTIKKFLNKVLDIEMQEADKSADAIEYAITKDVLIRLVNFMDFMEQCTCSEPKWINSCKKTLKDGELNEKCKTCNGGCCCQKSNT